MNLRIKDSIDLARLRGIEFQMAKHVSHNCVCRRSIYSFRSLLQPLAAAYARRLFPSGLTVREVIDSIGAFTMARSSGR